MKILLEKDLEKYLVKTVKALGGMILKLGNSGIAGLPDRLIIYKGKIFFVELKFGSRVSPLQGVTFKAIENHGFKVYIVNNVTEIDNLVAKITDLKV